LVYVPTGNTSPDYYGGQRDGLDYYSSSVVALHIDSGDVAWHFQTVHHDIWDFDVPSQPTFFDWERDGEPVLGLAQTTKQGYVFLLDRETGEPLFPSWRRQSHKVLLRETSRHPRSRFRASPDPCLNCRAKTNCSGG
jgi:quinoprotein glucose dehydrogenase